MKIQVKAESMLASLNVTESKNEQIQVENETIVTGGSASDYDVLINKPSINGVKLEGDKSLDELGIKEYTFKEGLKVNTKREVSVDVSNEVEEDNTKPITSAAVFTTVGNIDVLLKTI